MTKQAPPLYRTNGDVLMAMVSLLEARVVDVGCGDGSLSRFMTLNGAQVIGVEPTAQQLALAQSAAKVGAEVYSAGGAEDLPVPSNSVDIVVFFKSLHHVPVELHGKAMAEAARVLTPGGLLYICEPVAAGSYFELVRAVDDETDVRAAAYQTVQNATRHGLVPVAEETYDVAVVHADFASFRQTVIAPDPSRQAMFDQAEDDIRVIFNRVGMPTTQGWQFAQPMRINLLKWEG